MNMQWGCIQHPASSIQFLKVCHATLRQKSHARVLNARQRKCYFCDCERFTRMSPIIGKHDNSGVQVANTHVHVYVPALGKYWRTITSTVAWTGHHVGSLLINCLHPCKFTYTEIWVRFLPFFVRMNFLLDFEKFTCRKSRNVNKTSRIRSLFRYFVHRFISLLTN